MRDEGEALRRRAAERASRVGATASTMDEAWAEASDPAEVGDADAGADEAGAEEAEAANDADEAGEQTAGETPEEPSETAADVAVDSEAGRVEGDEEDPETKATRREGLN